MLSMLLVLSMLSVLLLLCLPPSDALLCRRSVVIETNDILKHLVRIFGELNHDGFLIDLGDVLA
jgi:hypothetical protein